MKSIGPDVLRHRIILTYEAEAQAVTTDAIIKQVFNAVRCHESLESKVWSLKSSGRSHVSYHLQIARSGSADYPARRSALDSRLETRVSRLQTLAKLSPP